MAAWRPALSIRLRLTAWYTLFLAVFLLGVVLSIRTLFDVQLRDDLDNRLLVTAADIVRQITVNPNYPDIARVDVPDLDPLSFPGLLTQVVDAEGRVVQSSDTAGDDPLPVAPLPPGTQEPAFLTSNVRGIDLRTVRVPIVADDGGGSRTIGAVVVGESFLPLDRTIAGLQRLLLVAMLVGLVPAALGGWLLAGRALRPVDRVTAAAAAIAAKSDSIAALTSRLPVPATQDEIARLAATFNDLLDRLEAAFAAQRRFIADASHELRTPLTAIRSNVDVLIQQAVAADTCLDGAEVVSGLDGIRRGAGRMGRLLDDLLQLARTDAGNAEQRPTKPVRLDLAAREAVETAGALATGQVLELDADEPVVVEGDADRLQQLALVLLENALRHTPAGGRITVEVARAGPAEARLIVRDTGEGIAPEHLPRIFDRFYRVDTGRARTTGGTGLGLAIARAIARSHGGDIAAVSTVGAGSTFTVTLPSAPTANSPEPNRARVAS